MNLEPKSIEEHIECLARMTGAPDSFVGQVKQLFSTKGIPLASDATPYLAALDEAFRREESIRAHSQAAHGHVTQMRQQFRKVGQTYVEQVERLKKIRSDLEGQSKQMRRSSNPRQRRSTTVAVPGDHRSFVTRPQLEQMPMVPGPKEPQ